MRLCWWLGQKGDVPQRHQKIAIIPQYLAAGNPRVLDQSRDLFYLIPAVKVVKQFSTFRATLITIPAVSCDRLLDPQNP